MKKRPTENVQKTGIIEMCIKYYQTIWYLILVVFFSIFIFHGFKPVITFDKINTENVLFSVWIILLFLPLIKSIDIAGIIKFVTKEDKKIAEELKKEKDSMVNVFNISNSNTQPLQESAVTKDSSCCSYGDQGKEGN